MARDKRKESRFWVNNLGEFQEILKIDAYIHGRSQPQHSAVVIIDYLKATHIDREEKIRRLAEKKGVTTEEFKRFIIEDM